MRLLQIFTAISVVLSATAAHGQSAVTGSTSCDLPHGSGVSSQQLVSGQRQRGYRLFVPPGYNGHLRLPLVLDLHGSGGTSADQARNSGFETLAEEAALTREGYNNGWESVFNAAFREYVEQYR